MPPLHSSEVRGKPPPRQTLAGIQGEGGDLNTPPSQPQRKEGKWGGAWQGLPPKTWAGVPCSQGGELNPSSPLSACQPQAQEGHRVEGWRAKALQGLPPARKPELGPWHSSHLPQHAGPGLVSGHPPAAPGGAESREKPGRDCCVPARQTLAGVLCRWFKPLSFPSALACQLQLASVHTSSPST